METTINSTHYEYQESIFGNKILAYTNLGGGVKVCNEEFICDEKIITKKQLESICKKIEEGYN